MDFFDTLHRTIVRYYIEDISPVSIETDIIEKTRFCPVDKSVFFHGAGDEARLHFCFAKIKVRPGPYPAATSPLDWWILLSSLNPQKKKQMHMHLLLFLERVTRLELATSTLARWRSTR